MEKSVSQAAPGNLSTGAQRLLYVNMRFLTQPLSGMQRYAEELCAALDAALARDPGYLGGARVVGLKPAGPARHRDWQAIELRSVGRLGGHAWEQVELAHAARHGVLISLAGSGPLSHPQHVLALHDANLAVNPQFYSRAYRTFHGFVRPRLARRARTLLTISAFSRRELARCYRVPEEQLQLVPDSAEHILGVTSERDILARYDLLPGRYALCVGNQSPNKNIALAIDAFAKTASEGMRLVIAGGSPAALTRAHTISAPWLTTLGRVTDGELRALYENAAVFVFPSLYEGFGVPPLEAMSLGCPVISSDSSAMPEVLGDAALFFSSGNVDSCAARLREVFALDAAGRQQLADRGRKRAARYRWDTSAERLGAILRAIDAA